MSQEVETSLQTEMKNKGTTLHQSLAAQQATSDEPRKTARLQAENGGDAEKQRKAPRPKRKEKQKQKQAELNSTKKRRRKEDAPERKRWRERKAEKRKAQEAWGQVVKRQPNHTPVDNRAASVYVNGGLYWAGKINYMRVDSSGVNIDGIPCQELPEDTGSKSGSNKISSSDTNNDGCRIEIDLSSFLTIDKD